MIFKGWGSHSFLSCPIGEEKTLSISLKKRQGRKDPALQVAIEDGISVFHPDDAPHGDLHRDGERHYHGQQSHDDENDRNLERSRRNYKGSHNRNNMGNRDIHRRHTLHNLTTPMRTEA